MAIIFYDFFNFKYESFYGLNVIGENKHENTYKMRIHNFFSLKKDASESYLERLLPGLDDYSKFLNSEEKYFIEANAIDDSRDDLFSYAVKSWSDRLNLRMIITKEEADTLKEGKKGIILARGSGYYLYRGDELQKEKMSSEEEQLGEYTPERIIPSSTSEKKFEWVIGEENGSVRTAILDEEKSSSNGEVLHCEVLRVSNSSILVRVDDDKTKHITERAIAYDGIDYSQFKPGQRIVIVKNDHQVSIIDEKSGKKINNINLDQRKLPARETGNNVQTAILDEEKSSSNGIVPEKKQNIFPNKSASSNAMLEKYMTFEQYRHIYRLVMSEGNPRALSIFEEMPYTDYALLHNLDRYGVRGVNLWRLYDKCCSHNYELFKLVMIMFGENRFSQDDIDDNLDPDSRFFIPFVSSEEYNKYKANGFGQDSFENWNNFCDSCVNTFSNELNKIRERSKAI